MTDKIRIKIVFITCLVVSLITSGCRSEKVLRILGFGYKGDVITIKEGEKRLLNFKIEGVGDTDRICFFSRDVSLSSNNDQLNLSVIIDSNNVIVLDTSIRFSKEHGKPFISVINPTETKRKRREVFIGDKKSEY